MSSLNKDPLEGLYVEEGGSTAQDTISATIERNDPLEGLYVEQEQEKPKEPYRDVVKEQQQAAGIEDDPFDTSEFERAADLGNAESMRGFFKGATFGASEYVPGLETKGDAASFTGELVGSILPIEALVNVIGKPLINLAKKSPIFKKSLESLASITGMGLAGATYGGTKHAVENLEVPSQNEVLKHGFEWAALDAALRTVGGVGAFAIGIAKQARKAKKPEFKIVNDVYTGLRNQGVDVGTDKRAGAKALSILEDMQATKKHSERNSIKTVDQLKFKNAEDSIGELAEPILPNAPKESLNVNSMVESSENAALRQRIDSVGQRFTTETELGQEVQSGISKAKEEAKAQYKPFYKQVEDQSRFITVNPKKTAKLGGDMIELMEEMKTNPAGYKSVVKTLEDTLHDVGYLVQRDKAGVIEDIIQTGDIPMNKLIELGRRLNEVVKYDALEWNVKDKLKSIVKAVKEDIRSGLKNADEDVLAAFELAEESFGINAEKFGRDSIKKIRGTQGLEAIPKQVESATALNDLRDVLTPQQMKNVERDMLEKMNRMTESKAEDFLRKVKAGLSEESQSIADDIIRSKRPINKQSIQSRTERMHEAIDNDLITAMNTGKRPTKTLELWQNDRGQKLVKDALESNPQKKELVEYLQKQTLQDMAKSIIGKDGHIDPKKLTELMDNPAIRNNLRGLGGQEAVDFFEQLSKRSESLKKNAQELLSENLSKDQSILKKPHGQNEIIIPAEKSSGEKGAKILKRMAKKDYPLAVKIKEAMDLIGFNGKVALNLFTFMKFGFVKGALIPIFGNIVQKMATSNKVRKAFIEASKQHTDPLAFIAAIENLGNTIDED